MNGGGGGGGLGWRPPFTAAQWQELEHQALIFKYMMAGVPVPQELLIPIRRSFEAMSSRYYHHPSLGYCYYGKKLDPEPGRCRRTDGKKWRCSKDAYPDSKYCERHMHRGRNRSRKPVETQSLPQSQSSSSTVTTTSAAAATAAILAGPGSSQLHTGLSSYPMHNKDFRYLQGVKPAMDEHSLFSEPSASARGIAMDSSLESSWGLMPSNISSFPLSKATNDGSGSLLHSNYSHQLQGMQDIGQASMSSMSEQQQQQQHAFFGTEFGSSESVKHESQSLRPFFDEWPKTREPWSNLDDDRCNRTSYSTTQLSISIPMASSDFSMTSSRSPNGD
ncbi:Growth-regulating factor protein [Dioscorea alata]|uniref:Growth-regulating factor protein n=1 Tax=Dioscorea alata TaxID=55571 RepID=A0ACB7WHG4_DIOAL|nr:Growth-regulating factor protein [Dioscorea alata]